MTDTVSIVQKRRTVAEQIAEKCIHFNGIMEKSCKAGVRYDDVRVTHDAVEYRREAQRQTYSSSVSLPCIGSLNYCGATCAKRQVPTPEEVATRELESKQAVERVVAARIAIVAAFESDGKSRGVIACPTCTADLHYSRATNGHIWAQCSTPDCAAWIE